jgi:hypothetical protein
MKTIAALILAALGGLFFAAWVAWLGSNSDMGADGFINEPNTYDCHETR